MSEPNTTEQDTAPDDTAREDAPLENVPLADAGSDDTGEATGSVAETASGSRAGRGSTELLEREGEIAADYLEELLDIADLDGDIDMDVENGRASVAILSEGGPDRQLRQLVGAHAEVLEALQELARLAVQARTGERSRLMLDVAG